MLFKTSTFLVLLAIMFSFSSYAPAASPRERDLWKLRQKSSMIIRGQVLSLNSYWKTSSDGNDIVTDITLKVKNRPRGNSGDTVIFQVMGGSVGVKSEIVSSMPKIQVGDETVVFLEGDPLKLVEGKRGYFAVKNGAIRWKQKKIDADTFINQLRLEQADIEYRLDNAQTIESAAMSSGGPVITSISPSKVSGGTNSQITISGSGFGPGGYPSAVEFTEDGSYDETIEGQVVSWSDTQIKCIVPPTSKGLSHTVSSGPVKVTTANWMTAQRDLRITFACSQLKWQNAYMWYYIKENTSDCTGEGAAVKRAANTWNNAGAKFAFYYDSTLSLGSYVAMDNGRNEIYWSSSSELDGAAAVTKVLYSGNEIQETDLLFNDDYDWRTGSVGYSDCDVETIALHELGHCFGLLDLYGDLGDGYDTDKAMFGVSYGGEVVRTLHPDDIAGITYIYGNQGIPLTDGVAVTGISGSTSSAKFYRITVPSGAAGVTFKIYGGSGNCNMYIRRSTLPTTTTYDHAAVTSTNTETISIRYPTAGEYYIMLQGSSSYSGMSLLADYSMYITLTDGLTRTGISGSTGNYKYFRIAVPAGAASLRIKSSGGTGNCNIYARKGALPTTSVYDRSSVTSTNAEGIGFSNPASGSWYILVHGASNYSGVSLLADYLIPVTLANNVAVTNIAGTPTSAKFYQIVVPAGRTRLTVKTYGGTGNCNLYVRKNYLPTLTTYDSAPKLATNTETIVINTPVAGNYFIMVYGADSYSGVSLKAYY